MGFDLDRFDQSIDSELKCAICCGVFDQPVQAIECEHIFCSKCIQEWLRTSDSCPIDRLPLDSRDLHPAPRIVRNLLSRLMITCDFESEGCSERVPLDQLPTHALTCAQNPDALRPCPQKCGAMVTQRFLPDHNCVRELRDILNVQLNAIADLRSSVTQLFQLISDHKQSNESNLQAIESLEKQQKQFEKNLINIEQPIQQLLQLQSNNTNHSRLVLKDKSNTCSANQTLSKDDDEEVLRKMAQNRLFREVTVDIFVSQLESVSEENIRDYVTKLDVRLLNCKLAQTDGSKNSFRLTIAKSDADKLLQSKIWPSGTSCFIMGRFYDTLVYGSKLVQSANETAQSLPTWMTN